MALPEIHVASEEHHGMTVPPPRARLTLHMPSTGHRATIEGVWAGHTPTRPPGPWWGVRLAGCPRIPGFRHRPPAGRAMSAPTLSPGTSNGHRHWPKPLASHPAIGYPRSIEALRGHGRQKA